MINYLVVGTGGVGASIAAFLQLGNKNVECIARGEHLERIREGGLVMESTLKGNQALPLEVYSSEEYTGKADVIFVCVKSYSLDSVIDLIWKASHNNTVVIPILNVYETGPKLQQELPGVTVLDGCIYIVGYLTGPGHLKQVGKIFRIVYGAHKDTRVDRELLLRIQKDLVECGIKADLSEDIQRDTFVKWSFISAMACTGAYYEAPMGEVQKPGEIRETFKGLSAESQQIGLKAGILFKEDMVEYNLKVIDKLAPESTSSMQRDIEKGNNSEIESLLFEMICLAEEYGVEIPTYQKVAEKFRK
ncbi:MAG: ketopantoate reductase family protein [Bacteroides sp.]|nr:ketopantoate reductase family protein [Bacteroides sp.]